MKHSPFYLFVVDSKYRLLRHLCFIFTLGIISFNQVFIAYKTDASLLGNKIFCICMASFGTYLLATYINYFVLIPRFLVRKKYYSYIILLIVSVFILLFATIFLEYKVRTFIGLAHRIQSYQNPLIFVDYLSSSMITMICFWSMSVIELFRTWNQKKEQIISLEHQFLESEVNKLKGQVSPIFLSKALQKASSLAPIQPNISSAILIKLSQLLRYQLYDCDREKVFLQSEINFISNFLNLYQLTADNHFEYSLDVKRQNNHVLISPLFLIALIQILLEKKEINNIKMSLETHDEKLIFDFIFSEKYILNDADLADIRNKLDALYPELYQLKSQTGNIELKLAL